LRAVDACSVGAHDDPTQEYGQFRLSIK
jgi:hypothetical protein